MAYSAVGSAYTGTGTTSPTVASVNPTAIGDILVVFVAAVGTGSPAVLSISHSGVTTWTRLVSTVYSSDYASEVWWGVVTATGSATLTVNVSGSPTDSMAAVQQFHSSASGTWTADANTATESINYLSSGTYPSVTPVDSAPLYLGSLCLYGGSTVSGAGGAWVSTAVTYGTSRHLLSTYNLSPGTGASAPAWSASSSGFGSACAGFLYVPSASLFIPPLVISQAVKRASFY